MGWHSFYKPWDYKVMCFKSVQKASIDSVVQTYIWRNTGLLIIFQFILCCSTFNYNLNVVSLLKNCSAKIYS